MQSTALVVFGAAVILGAICFVWAARPGVDGALRRFMLRPVIEPMFPVALMAVIITGLGMIFVGFGATIGTR